MNLHEASPFPVTSSVTDVRVGKLVVERMDMYQANLSDLDSNVDC